MNRKPFPPRRIAATTGTLVALALGAAAASIALPRPAAACSPITCRPGRLVPAEGATIPGGLQHLPFTVAAGADFGPQTVKSMAVTIRTEAGDPVPFAVVKDANDLFLKADLAANTSFRVQWTDPCYVDFPDGPPKTVTRRFQTGAVLAPPTLAATMVAGALQAGTGEVPTSSGSCTTDVPAGVVPVDLRLPDELVPFLPLLAGMVKVDSWPADFVPDNAFGNLPAPDAEGRVRVGQLWTRCGDPNPPDPHASPGGGRDPGRYTVSVRLALPPATVAWATPQDTAVDLSCEPFAPKAEPGPEPVPDAGALEADAVGDAAPEDGAVDAPAPAEGNDVAAGPASRGSNGCNGGPGTSSAGLLAGFLLAWAAFRASRRRAG